MSVFNISKLHIKELPDLGAYLGGAVVRAASKGLRWRSGQSTRLSPLRMRVQLAFSMLLEPSAPLM